MSLTSAEMQYQLDHIHENHGPLAIGVISMFLVIVVAAVAGRLYSKRLIKSQLGWDDYFILAALSLFCIMTAEVLASIKFGLGKHALALTPELGQMISKALFAFEVTYPALIFTVKASILFLYLRVFGWSFKYFQVAWWANMIWLCGLLIGYYIVTLTQCHPISAFWDVKSTEDLCRVSFAPTLTINCINVISDLGILILPIPAIWKLQMPLKRKIGTFGIFILGSLAIIVSIVRIPPILEVGTTSTDATFQEIPSLLLVFAEPTTGILCACLPLMRPLFFRSVQSLRSRTYTARTSINTTGRFERSWPTRVGNPWSSIGIGSSDDDGRPINITSTTTKAGETGFNQATALNKVRVDHEIELTYTANKPTHLEDGLGLEKIETGIVR